MKSWLLPAIALLCAGYLVWKLLHWKTAARLAEEDRATVEKWRALRASGFWRHLGKHRSGFFIPYFLCIAFADTWRSRSAVFPSRETLVFYALLAVLLTFLTTALEWFELKKQAAEAAARLARSARG